MSKLTQEELNEKLELHKKWILGDESGEKLLLIGADLRGVNLRHVNLNGADLSYANLSNADLSYAILRDAELRHAILRDTNLKYANLSCTDLRLADLSNADLRFAELMRVNFWNADLMDANLSNSDLRDADLKNANLSRVNLRGTNTYVSTCDKLIGINLVLISNVGSENRRVVFDIDNDVVYCGCWKSNFKEFKKRIEDIYGKNGDNPDEQYYEEYQNVITHFETKLKYTKEK